MTERIFIEEELLEDVTGGYDNIPPYYPEHYPRRSELVPHPTPTPPTETTQTADADGFIVLPPVHAEAWVSKNYLS